MNFDFIFTGCYKLWIKPKIGHHSRQPCSASFSINTEHVKTLLPKPIFNPLGKDKRYIEL